MPPIQQMRRAEGPVGRVADTGAGFARPDCVQGNSTGGRRALQPAVPFCIGQHQQGGGVHPE